MELINHLFETTLTKIRETVHRHASKNTFIQVYLREYHKGEGGTVKMSNGKELDVSRRKKEFFVGYMKDHFKY